MKKVFTWAILMAATVTTYAEEPAAEESRWTTNGGVSLQFTQGFVSKNWYKGGESNFSLLSTADYTFNYKYENFTWDNRLEGKLGFVTTPSDTCHNYMTNNDYIKYTTKFGYKAAGDWYYTLQAVGQTQFCPGYKTNERKEFSKFMNPAYLTVALGMDYKKSLENISWTIFMSPMAYNLKYVNNPYKRVADSEGNWEGVWDDGRINAKAFGLRNSYDYNLYDFGVNAKASMDWKVCKYLTWSRLGEHLRHATQSVLLDQALHTPPFRRLGRSREQVWRLGLLPVHRAPQLRSLVQVVRQDNLRNTNYLLVRNGAVYPQLSSIGVYLGAN